MAKISPLIKEILNTALVLIIVGVLVTAFVIYPLDESKAILGRADLDDYNPDSTVVNDPTAFVEAGLQVDTFSIETDGLTTLAAVYVNPAPTDSATEPGGTTILLHQEQTNRESLIPLAAQLSEKGLAVMVYDQRASSRSTGKYHGDGSLESGDLEAVIAFLDLRGLAPHPLTVIGFSVGAEAALLAAGEESRIDRVAAVDPYLSSERMMNILRQRHDLYWFPFSTSIIWWWYGIRSGYALNFRTSADITGVDNPTLVLLPEDALSSPEVARLKELSPAELLTIQTIPSDTAALETRLVEFATEPDQEPR